MYRVIEVGQIVAGPMAGLLFSELGFEVIKIEEPGKGDVSRQLTGVSSGTFAFLNRGKKSLTLNLKSQEGRGLFVRLVEKSDVVIDNLGPETLTRLGLGYDVLRRANPRIVYLKIKGFGPGPDAWRKSLDFPAEVESGIAYMNGLEGRPMRLGASMIDIFAASLGVIGVLAGLLERGVSGVGCYVEVPLFEAATFLMGQHLASAQALGRELRPLNEEPFTWGVYDFFETGDAKKIFVAVTTDSQWREFCLEFDALHLWKRPELQSNAGRYANRSWLIPEIAKIIKGKTLVEVVEKLNRSNVAYGVLNKSLDLLKSKQLEYDGKMMNVRNTDGKLLKVPRVPIYNESGVIYPQPPGDPPRLGEHTDQILRDLLGVAGEDIARLHEEHVV